MKMIWLAAAALPGVFAFGTIAPVATAAADTMMSSNCSSADSSMVTAMQSGDTSMMKASGDVDKDFAGGMMAITKSGTAMAKLEIKCGKNAKAKAMAQRYITQSTPEMTQLNELLGGGH
jgi:uncharacterized protein (DUF305 family)